MAFVFNTQGQYDAAAEYYEKCLDITLKLPDRDNLRAAEARSGLGNVYEKQGKYREALELLELSVATKVALPSAPPRRRLLALIPSTSGQQVCPDRCEPASCLDNERAGKQERERAS